MNEPEEPTKPLSLPERIIHNVDRVEIIREESTVRDRFAMTALGILIHAGGNPDPLSAQGNEAARIIARQAYGWADVVLEVRNRKPSP